MDLWVVAAAAGAGYLAKYWNKISNNDDNSSCLSSKDSYVENPDSPSSSFPFPFPKQAQRDKLGKDVSLDRASNRGLDCEEIRHFRNYNANDLLSISNSPVSFSPNDKLKYIEDGNEEGSNIVGNHGFFLPDSSAEVVHIHNSSGNKTSLRTKHLSGHICRPLESLESCFMAQLYKEQAKMEEYVFSTRSSSSTATRSFLVSDGSRIISRAHENVFGVLSLPKIGSFNDAEKTRSNTVVGRSRKLSSSNDAFSGRDIHIQCDTTFLFSLGISFGMIACLMANKREMNKLRELLKQTQNLVQDLQEELDMKDSMTVKELRNENYGSQDTCDHSFYDKELNGFSPEKHMDNTPRIDCEESHDQREEQSLESMSKIEAELEAELERLGLDMNASSLERKLSELVELDPEFVADFAQGEFQADKVSGKEYVHPKSNEDACDTTPLPGTYAVSPHELSLRLHEVIQSQLEERVKELEIALENSERKVQLMESEQKSCSQKASSFTRGNILVYEDSDTMVQPLILNLSGEALDAYNEAYEELIKIDDSEENSPSGIHDSNPKEGSHSHDWHALGVQHGANGSITCSPVNEGKLSRELSSSQVTMLDGQTSGVYDLNVTGNESCGYDNEVERQLIRQIVERTKKGSPFFQNAQRILYSMDEDEH